jgi:type 2 lantibiotic biosynthesis protein LanM
MSVSQLDLINILEKASSLSDRFSDQFTPDESQANDHLIDIRLERWCQVAAKGDRTKFEKRLAWDNLNLEKIRSVLGSVKYTHVRSLPQWIEILSEVIDFIKIYADSWQKYDSSEYPYLASQEPLPFEDLLVPFIEIAKQKLHHRSQHHYHLISEKALAYLERGLLKQLVGLCAFTFELEFAIARSTQSSSLIRQIEQLQDHSTKQFYSEFVHRLIEDGLLNFFQEYSVLARLMTTTLMFWVDSVEEFLSRLAADWHTIQTTFAEDTLSSVVALQGALSDSHNNGRSIFILKFDSGLKLVYKPKNLGLEQAYFQLLAWFNDHDVPLPFKLLKVINCSTYGWMEFAEAFPCDDPAEIERFYQRAGMVLCIVYSLRGTDCHYENLLACGEQPVLVDLETLLHHRIWTAQEDTASALANEQLQDSVAGTALLPGWQLVPYGQGEGLKLDLSGFGGFAEKTPDHLTLKWQHVNTDNMVIEHEYTKLSPKQNRPFRKGVTTSPSDYSEAIATGFQQMYRFLIQHRDTLLSANGPLATFAHQKVRLVFRNTSVYFTLLRNSLVPKFLRDGADFSIEFELLSRAFVAAETKPPFWALLTAEQRSLEQLDIPYFAAYSDSNALIVNPEQTIASFLTQPSYDDVLSRIRQLSETDLIQQTYIIRGSLYSCINSKAHDSLPIVADDLVLSTEPATPEALIEGAVAIARLIQQQAIYGADNSATWIGMTYVSSAQRFQMSPVGFNLYDGCCGIALFLAALTVVTQNEEFSDLGLNALQPLLKMLQATDHRKKLVDNLGIGAAYGLGSVIYTLVRVGQLLEQKSLLQMAEQTTELLQLSDPAISRAPGITRGTAGAILGLLTLHQASPNLTVLAHATAMGKQLLNERQLSNTGHQIWVSQTEPLTGFLDGTAGIAYALLRLYEVTQDFIFLTAAEEAIAYERSVFLNGSEKNPAIDLVLPYLGSSELDPADIRHELDTALSVAQRSIQTVDSVCRGNFRDIEFLLIASQSCSKPLLVKTARQKTAWMMNRFKEDNSFQLLPNLSPDVFNPGFFQGMAGIGYEFLRLASPQHLSSVLLWQ